MRLEPHSTNDARPIDCAGLEQIVARLAAGGGVAPVPVVILAPKTLLVSRQGARFRRRHGVGRIEVAHDAPARPDDQLRALLAHELGHSRQWPLGPRVGLVVSVAGLIVSLMILDLVQGRQPGGLVAVLIIAFVGLLFVGLAWSRREEYDADRFAVGLVGAEAVTTMLCSLAWKPPATWSPRWCNWLAALCDTHPSPTDRIKAINMRTEATA